MVIVLKKKLYTKNIIFIKAIIILYIKKRKIRYVQFMVNNKA